MSIMIDMATVRAAAGMPISTELWRLIDDCQRPYVYEVPIPFDEPLTLITPLTPEQAEADEYREAAINRLRARIDRLYATPAPKHLNCGKTGAIHIRRSREDGRVEDALIRTHCGRSDCPYCWRRRICRTYRRAAACLLDAPGEQYLPRVEPLYLGETTWREWSALDRSIRRRHGGACGRVRVRRADDTVLIVAAQPFRGAAALPPHEAYAAIEDAIAEMHTARHSYRQLGAWAAARQRTWRMVERFAKGIDLGDVMERLGEVDRLRRKAIDAEAAGRTAAWQTLRLTVARLRSDLERAEMEGDAKRAADILRELEPQEAALRTISRRLREERQQLPMPLYVRRSRIDSGEMVVWKAESEADANALAELIRPSLESASEFDPSEKVSDKRTNSDMASDEPCPTPWDDEFTSPFFR